MGNPVFNTSLEYEYQKLIGGVNLNSNTFKLILMKSGYVFDNVNHSAYSDVSASELGTANGYTAGGVTLVKSSPPVVSKDTTNKKAVATWDAVNIAASGGDITACAAIIIDTSFGGGGASSLVIGCMSFGGDQTAVDGQPISFGGITLRELVA